MKFSQRRSSQSERQRRFRLSAASNRSYFDTVDGPPFLMLIHRPCELLPRLNPSHRLPRPPILTLSSEDPATPAFENLFINPRRARPVHCGPVMRPGTFFDASYSLYATDLVYDRAKGAELRIKFLEVFNVGFIESVACFSFR